MVKYSLGTGIITYQSKIFKFAGGQDIFGLFYHDFGEIDQFFINLA